MYKRTAQRTVKRPLKQAILAKIEQPVQITACQTRTIPVQATPPVNIARVKKTISWSRAINKPQRFNE